MTSTGPLRPRVLIADDHPEVAKAICRLLTLDCDVVGIVTDGGEVVEAVRRLHPDVAVVDLNLPTLSGLETCRQLTAEHPDVKVIIFSAENDSRIRERSFELGASAYFCKVSADGDLLDAIRCLCDLP